MTPRTKPLEQRNGRTDLPRNGGHEGKVAASLFKELMGGHLPMLSSYRHENGKMTMPVEKKRAKDPREEGPMQTPEKLGRRSILNWQLV